MLSIKPGNFLCIFNGRMIEVAATTEEIARKEAFNHFLRHFEELPNYDPTDYATNAFMERRLYENILIFTIPNQIEVLDCSHFAEDAGEAVQIPTCSVRISEDAKGTLEQIKAMVELSTSFEEADEVIEKHTENRTCAQKIAFLNSLFDCKIAFKEGEYEEVDYVALITSIINKKFR